MKPIIVAAALAACLAAVPAEAAHARNHPGGYSHSAQTQKTHHGPSYAALGHARKHHVAGFVASGHNASVFCDRRTASGGMNCGAMQFAHKTLPLRSWHTLCSNGGRCVFAQVVDRGPYVAGREYDLSPGLARALGVDGLGTVVRR
jgi:rare lipoprotein A (peptidoglycan hydrolase)